MRAQRLALRALLVSVLVSALLGIIAVLGEAFGETEIKLLITSVAISIAAILAVASFTAWELRSARALSRTGVATAVAALLMLLFGMWTERSDDDYWRVMLSLTTIAAAAAHGSLLSLARLAPRYQWARPVTLGVGAFLVAAILAALWQDHHGDGIFQAIAVLAILDGAGTLAMIAFHYMSRDERPAGAVAEVCFCPRCGKRLWEPAGEVRCRHCEQAFYIELRVAGAVPTAVVRKPD